MASSLPSPAALLWPFDDDPPCRVYWGHAGCAYPRGHGPMADGQPHSDLPGHAPFPRSGEGLEYVFGEDWDGPPA